MTADRLAVAEAEPDVWRVTTIIETMVSTMGAIMVPLGVLMFVMAMVMAIRKLMAPDDHRVGWAGITGFILLSGFMISGTAIFRVLRNGFEAAFDDGSTGPPEEQGPAQAPDAPSPDPIVLPEVHNLGTLLLVAAGLVVLAAGYFVWRRVAADRRSARLRLQEESAARSRLERAWAVFVDRHAELKREFLASETDWDSLFELPALTDPSVPQTAAMLRAMSSADRLDQGLPSDASPGDDLGALPYPRAVARFEQAWSVARANARKVGQSLLPQDERKRIALIRDLLRIAESPGGNANERDAAYRRIQSLLEELRHVVVPRAAVAEIEEHQRLMLEAGAPSSAIAL